MTLYCIQLLICIVIQIFCADPALDKRIKRQFLFVALIILVVPSALREDVGTDYSHYVNLFNQIQLAGLQGAYTELGFNALVLLLAKLGLPAQSLFAVSGLLLGFGCFAFVTNCIKQDYWGLAVFLFIGFGFYYSSMNLVRQYIAFSIGLFALVALKRERFRSFAAITLLASLFHMIAAILLIIPLLNIVANSRHGRRFVIFGFCLSLLFIFVDVRSIISKVLELIPRWSWYTGSDYFNSTNYLARLKLIVPNVIVIYSILLTARSSSRYVSCESCDRQYFSDPFSDPIFLGGLCYVCCQNLFCGIMVLTRVSEIFGMCFIYYLVKVISFNRHNKTSAFFIEWLLYGYCIALTGVTIFLLNGNGVMPYKSIFN